MTVSRDAARDEITVHEELGAASITWSGDAALVVEVLELRARSERLLRDLHGRAAIDQACGMLTVMAPCSGERAWELLVDVSQHCDVQLRDVAAALVATADNKALPVDMRHALRAALSHLRASSGLEEPAAAQGAASRKLSVPRDEASTVPRDQDVVAVLLKDHRTMEDLFRQMRSVEADRAGALKALAALLVAHGQAEESEVYPALKRFKKVDNDEVDQGVAEHAQGNEALLALLAVTEIGSQTWGEKLERLVEAVSRHVDEEERTILNGARQNVPDARRAELGQAFIRQREKYLAEDCGNIDHVRRVVRH